MGTQGASQHSYTLDADTLLHDAAALTATGAGEVGAVAKVLDFGGASPGTGVINIAHTKGDLIVDVRVIDVADADETYTLVYQLGDAVGFGGVVVNRAQVSFGAAGGLATSGATADGNTQRRIVGVDNEFDGTIFRFARLFAVIAGTTPSIEPYVWFAERK